MKKLVFLITAWLVHEMLCSTDLVNKTDADIERILDRISENVLSSLMNSLSLPLPRTKRELSMEKQSLTDDNGVFRLTSVRPVSELCYPAIQTLFLDISNTTYAVCISGVSQNPAQLMIGYYKEHKWTIFHSRFINNPGNAVAFHYDNHIYLLVADSEREKGTELIKINLQTNSSVMYYSVTSNYATRIAVWYMKSTRTYNLAIANTDGNKDSDDFGSEVLIFEWKGTYFDRYSEFRAFDVKDIEPFYIHDVAYMAVANFRRGKDKNAMDSEILRYDYERKWVSHQKIRTYGAMDWEFFSLGTALGQEFFLALANYGDGNKEARSMIYKFVVDKFVPFQCLPTSKATSFASYSKDGIFVLAVANEDDAVHLYQYDGWRFVKSGVQWTNGAMSYGVKHIEFHKVKKNSENVLILSVSNPRHIGQSVFEIGLVKENMLQDWHDRSTEWCLDTLSKLESRDIDKTIGSFDDVIFIDQPSITINGDVVFKEGFVAETLKTPKLTEVKTSEVFDNNLLNKLADLHRRIDLVQEKLMRFSNILKNSLKIEGNQTIKNHLEFQDAEFKCTSHSCHFENIYTPVLNQESVADWKNQLVFLDSEQVINGTLWANEVSASSIHVLGFIDGVKSENLITKSGDHSIKARKTFKKPVSAKGLEVSGRVDGLTISPANILVTTGHQMLLGEISFDDLNTTWLRPTYVNGRDLAQFLHDLVLTDKPYTVTGQKTFSDVTVNELIMTPGSTINGVDLMDLWKNALWKNGRQDITAELTFTDVMFKNVKVSHGVNGIQIPGPRIVDITENARITAPQTFTNSTKIEYLTVQGSLNGIPLVQAPDGSKQLDILLKTGDQIITGRKIFHTIHLDGNSDVYGTVDGVDLSEFKALVLHKNSSVVTDKTWVFNNLTIMGPLTVEGTVSGVKLDDVYRRALKLNESIVSEMIFNDLVYVKDLQSNDINGINVRRDLVLTDGAQELTGDFTFTEIIIEDDVEIQGLINDMDFSFLDEVLLRIGNQRIKSKVFKRNVNIKNLSIHGSINGIPVSDILTLKGGQISGSRILNNVTFQKIDAKNVEVTGKVNNIKIEEMIKDTMTYDGEEIVTGEKDIKGTIYVAEGTDINIGQLNGINLKELWDDAVFIDVPQSITGMKTFSENVVFNNLSFSGSIDGVSDWEMKNWMLRDAPQTIESDVVFLNGFSAHDLKVKRVNGLDLKQLESEIVKVNETTEIKGSVIFEKSVISDGDISLLGRIQGVDLSEEAVDKNKVIVEGDKTFTQDLVIEGDLSVDGLVDGVNINDICNNTFLTNRDVNISKLVIKGDVTLLGDGFVGGNIAGVDLSLFHEIAVSNKGPEIKFDGTKIFTNLTFAGPITLKGKFGNADLKDLDANYLSLTRDQEIPVKMTFDDFSFKGNLFVNDLYTANGEINNINLEDLNSRVLKTRGSQNVTAVYHIDNVHFTSDVIVTGNINGLKLPEGVMRRNRANYIQSPKIFAQPVIVRGDLDMEDGSTIQDVDVSDWYQKAVLKGGKFHIHGLKTFNNLDLIDVKVEGSMDGLKISEDSLLMSYGNQVITKRKTVAGNVTIEGSLTVNGDINNINLTRLALETLQRDRINTITGPKHFTQPLTIVSLEAPSVSGIDIVKLKDKLNNTVKLDDLENKLGEMESVVKHMQEAFDNQAVLFQYYELFGEFDLSVYDWLYISNFDCSELLLLLDNSGSSEHCSSIKVFGYDKTADYFVPTRQELPTSNAISVASLTLNNATHLFVANQKPCLCLGNYSVNSVTVDIYSWNVEEFAKLQSFDVRDPTDMIAFKDGNVACLVVLEVTATKVFCSFAPKYQSFTQREILSTTGGQKVSVIQSLGRIILAIAAEDNSYARQNYAEGESSVDIYVWDSKKAEFGARKQLIQSVSAHSVALIKHADGKYESLFLAVAKRSIPKINNEAKILIYRYKESSNSFEEYQEIKDYGILEWITLNTGELIFFAVDSQQGLIKIYQHKGVSRFVKIDTVKSLGVKKVRAFIRSDPQDSLNHYLALAGDECKPKSARNVYHAKILKSKLKGKRPVY